MSTSVGVIVAVLLLIGLPSLLSFIGLTPIEGRPTYSLVDIDQDGVPETKVPEGTETVVAKPKLVIVLVLLFCLPILVGYMAALLIDMVTEGVDERPTKEDASRF